MILNSARGVLFSAVLASVTFSSFAQEIPPGGVAAALQGRVTQGVLESLNKGGQSAASDFGGSNGPGKAAPLSSFPEEDKRTALVSIPGFPPNLRPFGEQLFARIQGKYVTPTDLPVPADYVIGVGDTVEVRLFGKENRVHRLMVERNGSITIPDIGAVSVAGLTLENMGQMLLERIAKQKIGVEATVSMGPLRSIQIFLMGDVNYPGAVTTDALTTVSNALIFGGGIKQTGSMRRVEIRRLGKVISRVDLYASLLKGSDQGELRLQSGDVVFVPAVGKRVGVDGEVLRPAIYELLQEKTVDDLIHLAGGFKATAFPGSAKMNRVGRDWQRSAVIRPMATLEQRKLAVQDGDIFEIPAVLETRMPSVADFRFKTVHLEGSFAASGNYAWKEGLHLGELIPRFEELPLDTYRPLAVIQRVEALTGARKLLTANLSDVVRKQKVVPLERDDRIFLFDFKDIEFLSSAHVQQVLAGKLPTTVSRSATGVILDAQAARTDVSAARMDVSAARTDMQQPEVGGRKNNDPEANNSVRSGNIVGQSSYCRGLVELSHIVANEGTQRFRSALFAGAYDDDGKRLVKSIPCPTVFENTPALLPFLLENAIMVRGEINQPGVLPVPEGMTLDVAFLALGGLTREADRTGIEINQLVSGGGGESTVQRRRLQADAGLEGIKVEPGLVVQIRKRATEQETGLVRLSGEFAHPGAYEVRKGEKLSELIARAGSLTKFAYPYGAVFLRPRIREEKIQYYAKAASDLRQNALFAVSRPASANGAANGAAIVELSRQLLVTDPVGRMVVEADPTVLQVRPELDVALEPGDELYIPRRPSTILVMGEVLNPGAVQFQSGKRVDEYVRMVGGLTRFADEDRVIAVLPNGGAEPVKISSWNFQPTLLPPGSVIYVGREAMTTTPLDLVQISLQVIKDLALSAASLSVISK